MLIEYKQGFPINQDQHLHVIWRSSTLVLKITDLNTSGALLDNKVPLALCFDKQNTLFCSGLS